MTLICKRDLDNLQSYLHAKFQVCMSARLAVRVVTGRQTHTLDQNYYMSQTWGLNMGFIRQEENP